MGRTKAYKGTSTFRQKPDSTHCFLEEEFVEVGSLCLFPNTDDDDDSNESKLDEKWNNIPQINPYFIYKLKNSQCNIARFTTSLSPKRNKVTDDLEEIDPYENLHEESVEFIPLWQRTNQLPSTSNELTTSSDIVRFLEDEGIENITLIDVREKCDFTNWMIIGEGKTINHLVGAAGSLYKTLKDNIKRRSENQSNSFINNYPVVEGRDSDDWVLIDSGNIFVHLFTPEARKYRNLEGLWENVLIPSSSEERMRRITKDMEQEFKNYDPKFIKHPHLSKSVDSVD
ncbi:39975_t:CDS:2 [Gigaspora margarita]|uniref:39975_t:CDS:1 n=1 Tax=Gigaspora margarita TaxID=4874 RepID=A0ABM8W154_GIGMA|nr:39975_t:CDS:2 [Gigaspora margarita]